MPCRKIPPRLPLRIKKEGPHGLRVREEVLRARLAQVVDRDDQAMGKVGPSEVRLGLFVPSPGLNPARRGFLIAPRAASLP